MNMKKKKSKCCFQATYDPKTYNFNSDSTVEHNKLYYNRLDDWTGHGSDFDLDKKVNKSFSIQLNKVINQVSKLLKEKNIAYGNSALEPANIFSKLDAIESLCSRIDDKLMRISNKGLNDKTEDTLYDLIGYLILLVIALEKKGGH